MRRYIRHPSDVPIEYYLSDGASDHGVRLKNVSRGGICFRTAQEVPSGAVIRIRIPLAQPPFEFSGIVAWSEKIDGEYEVGVEFTDEPTRFSIRMVEQVCYIEHYKREVQEKEGRNLTGDQAAAEWISRHAGEFPR